MKLILLQIVSLIHNCLKLLTNKLTHLRKIKNHKSLTVNKLKLMFEKVNSKIYVLKKQSGIPFKFKYFKFIRNMKQSDLKKLCVFSRGLLKIIKKVTLILVFTHTHAIKCIIIL